MYDTHFAPIEMFWVCFFGSPNTAKDSIFYSYTRHINGFAATLEEEVAAEIASKNHVSSFFSIICLALVFVS